jgi:hypothetical protein
MANSPLLLIFSSVENLVGTPDAMTERPNTLDFLVEHFTFLGIDFQWWMPIIVGAVSIYVAWLSCTGRLFESPGRELGRRPKNEQGASERIPANISAAFGEAVILLIQWQGGADEPTVTLDAKPVLIGFVFELVIGRKYELLLTYAREEQRRRVQADALRLVPTYEVGARCLLKWVGDKKSESRAYWRGSSARLGLWARLRHLQFLPTKRRDLAPAHRMRVVVNGLHRAS